MASSSAVRHAEKLRASTCPFADNVARAVIGEFQSHHAAVGSPFEGIQTVLAGFVLQPQPGAPLVVLSWAVGTKYISRTTADLDPEGQRVRDCHAEVLARRGLLRYLGGLVCAQLRDTKENGEEEDRSWLQRDSETGKYGLVEGATLHFYVSSAPCGNACLKRWANGRKERPMESFANRPHEWPGVELLPHPRLSFPAKREGQIAGLVKQDAAVPRVESTVATTAVANDSAPFTATAETTAEITTTATTMTSATTVETTTSAAETATSTCTIASNAQRSCGKDGVVAPGTCFPNETLGRTRACSDKVALWNCLGVQGGRLAHWLRPLHLSTIVVGRKFSRPHLQRALCCRMQDFGPRHPASDAGAGLLVNHPSMLCTGVYLDNGTLTQDGGTLFTCHVSLCWSRGDARPERIDGSTGMSMDSIDGVAAVSRCKLEQQLMTFSRPSRSSSSSSSNSRNVAEKVGKEEAYMRAREALLSDTKRFFSPPDAAYLARMSASNRRPGERKKKRRTVAGSVAGAASTGIHCHAE